MSPTLVSPPWMPETNQLTPVLVVPVTEAVKRCDCPAGTVAAIGEIETDNGPDAPVAVGFVLPPVPPLALAPPVGFVPPLALATPLPLLFVGDRGVTGVRGVRDDPGPPRPTDPLHELRHSPNTSEANVKLFRASCPRRQKYVDSCETTGFLSGLKGEGSLPQSVRLAY